MAGCRKACRKAESWCSWTLSGLRKEETESYEFDLLAIVQEALTGVANGCYHDGFDPKTETNPLKQKAWIWLALLDYESNAFAWDVHSAQVQSRYKKLALRFHPDKNNGESHWFRQLETVRVYMSKMRRKPTKVITPSQPGEMTRPKEKTTIMLKESQQSKPSEPKESKKRKGLERWSTTVAANEFRLYLSQADRITKHGKKKYQPASIRSYVQVLKTFIQSHPHGPPPSEERVRQIKRLRQSGVEADHGNFTCGLKHIDTWLLSLDK